LYKLEKEPGVARPQNKQGYRVTMWRSRLGKSTPWHMSLAGVLRYFEML